MCYGFDSRTRYQFWSFYGMTNYTARYRLVIELEVDMQFLAKDPENAQRIALAYLPQLNPDHYDWKATGQMVAANPTLYALDKVPDER